MVARINRRTLLRGMAGIAVGLPALEATMSKQAAAAPASIPKRFVLSWVGLSTGMGQAAFIEPTTGAGTYGSTLSLKPLFDLSVEQNVSVVTGLTLPWDTGSGIPPGGRSKWFHYNQLGPHLAGTSTTDERDGTPRGPTADQQVSDAISASNQRVLAYRVEPVNYTGGSDGRMSYRNINGTLTSVDPIASPRLAYEALFSAFVPPDPAAQAEAQFLLRQRKSVLDFVGDDAESLLKRLGAADRARMQQHLDEIRALELRLNATVPVGSSCSLLPNPGEDPPVGAFFDLEPDEGGIIFAADKGYSNEDKRADLLTDFIAMAFACDMSRVASIMFTHEKCYMNAFPVTPGKWESDMHELTHGAGPAESLGESIAFFVKQFARLASKLKKVPEVDGGTVLDNSALCLCFEGGHGEDPESGDSGSPHSTENMTVLIAGGAGGLKGGQHVVAAGQHPAKAVISAMHAVGAVPEDGKLGEVSGSIPGLFA